MSDYTPGPWCVSNSECLACGYEWTAVHPLAADNLECAKCGRHDTVRFEIEEEEPDEHASAAPS